MSPKNASTQQSTLRQVYEKILAQLIEQGSLAPQRLSVASLAEEFAVSRTPISMALLRLECEGLVRNDPAQGWVTTPPTRKDIDEIFEIREILEPFLARKAAENVSPEAASELLACVEEMEKAAETNDLQAFYEMDFRYHDQIDNIVGNGRLHQINRLFKHQLSRITVGLGVLDRDRLTNVCKEHRATAEAIAAGSPELAAEIALKRVRTVWTNEIYLMENVLEPLLGLKR